MVVLQTRVSVEGITGKHVTEFFINCTDSDYQRWWEGTHLEFHTINRTTDGRWQPRLLRRVRGQTPIEVQGQNHGVCGREAD